MGGESLDLWESFMSERVNTLHLDAPAKLNLRLEILKKREDGYHEIRTIFQKINLYDTLHFALKERRGIRITTEDRCLPTGRKNLIYQALRSMLEKSDYKGGVDVQVEKRIPLGAGLGGGSSNAAAALKAMNELLKMNLGKRELMEAGAKIGADVPFFLFEGSAIGTGIGERLRKITLPPLWYILIYPNFEISTRWAYQNFVLTKSKYHINLQRLLKSPDGVLSLLQNDLEGTVSARHPEITQMKEMLISSGAMDAMMTGSGPTVFGLHSDGEQARNTFNKLKKKARGRGWKVFQAHSIP